MKPAGKLPPQDWITFPETVRVMNAIMAGGKLARFVGGCVRDAILGRDIADVDIATAEPPTRVVRLLKDAGIQVIPFGLDHGSVLAVQPNMTYHITTLRADLETYGRHARVDFIDDWQEDAIRRDFTMNALYADLDGTFYDPAGGVEDIMAGRVRFIGDPLERIHEDYLRVLRFFRFQAYYGLEPPTEEHLAACQQAASHLRQLSGERVWYELKRLLLSDNPVPALKSMEKYGILSVLFSHPVQTTAIEDLVKLEHMHNTPKCAIRRLACLLGDNLEAARNIRQDLPLSTHELSHLVKLIHLIHEKIDLSIEYQNYKLLYEQGPETYLDYILLSEKFIEQGQQYLNGWTSPVLPIGGHDLLARGLVSGPNVGLIIKEVTEWWLRQACKPNHDQCLQWLQNRNKL